MLKSSVSQFSGWARRLCLVSLVVFAVPLAGHAQEQVQQAEAGQSSGSDTGQDGTVTMGQLEDLVSTLEDADERAVFLDNLKALIAAEQGQGDDGADGSGGDHDPSLRIIDDITAGIDKLDDNLGDLLTDFRDGGGLAEWFDTQTSDPDRADLWVEALWQLLVIAVAAGVVGWLIKFLLRGHVRRLEDHGTASWAGRFGMTLLRLALLLVAVAAMAGGAYGAMALLALNSLAGAIATPVVLAIIVARSLLIVAKCGFSPLVSQLRLVPLADRQAAYLYVWTARFIVVVTYGVCLAELLLALGVPDSVYIFVTRLLALMLVAMMFVFILQVRQNVADWIREHPSTGGAQVLRNRVADIWHVIALLMVVSIFLVWLLEVEGGFGFLVRGSVVSVFALFVALVISTSMRSGLDRLFTIREDLRVRYPGLNRRANKYVFVLRLILNVVVWFVATVVILEAWGIDALTLMARPEGVALLGHIINLAIIALVAVLAWELGDGLITNRIAPSAEDDGSARLRTLLPLLRKILLVTICTITVITILSELGIDIGPLLAGAGVVGLAVGFGAQALVRDVITGAFILFEDQVQVGDFVEAGGKMGTVELLSIRTMQMRDLDGYVHTVPFGEVTSVTNMTRDYGYAVIDVGVAYQENTDHVLEVIKDVDKEAREDEVLAERMVGDLEVFGVHSLDDSAVTVRVRIKTLAGYQWGIRREYFRRIKMKFDEVGIEIPFPHTTVYFGETKSGHTPPAHLRIDAGDMKPAEGGT